MGLGSFSRGMFSGLGLLLWAKGLLVWAAGDIRSSGVDVLRVYLRFKV